MSLWIYLLGIAGMAALVWYAYKRISGALAGPADAVKKLTDAGIAAAKAVGAKVVEKTSEAIDAVRTASKQSSRERRGESKPGGNAVTAQLERDMEKNKIEPYKEGEIQVYDPQTGTSVSLEQARSKLDNLFGTTSK